MHANLALNNYDGLAASIVCTEIALNENLASNTCLALRDQSLNVSIVNVSACHLLGLIHT